MFKIISDTACDFTLDFAESLDITLVPFYLTFDKENYIKDLYDITTDEFYEKLLNEDLYPKTSLPSVQDYIDTFLPYVKEGVPVVCITISTVFSGSYNSASMARDQLLENYPDAKIAVINSQLNAAAQGLLVYEAARMNRDNIDFDICVKTLNKLVPMGSVYFTIDSLEYLKKGGRIGNAASAIAGILSIKPTIYMKNGELNIASINRTRKKAKNAIIDAVKKVFQDNHFAYEDYNFVTGCTNNLPELAEFKAAAESTLGTLCIDSITDFRNTIAIVTGCHTGPNTIGLAYMPKYETVIES